MIRQQQGGSVTSRLAVIAVANRKPRVPMPASRRAKQFMPFDALRGLKEAIAAKEKRLEPRRELSGYMKEEINKSLSELHKGQQVTVVYYGQLEQETLQITGSVVKVDPYWQTLQIDRITIDFAEIYEII